MVQNPIFRFTYNLVDAAGNQLPSEDELFGAFVIENERKSHNTGVQKRDSVVRSNFRGCQNHKGPRDEEQFT